MKKQLPSFFAETTVNKLSKSLQIVVLMSMLFIIPQQIISQVTFTQTTDADFNLGFHDNVIVSGNNVYLATKATSVNNWLSTNDLPQTLIGHQVTRWLSYVYLSGGFNGTNYSDAVYRATMQSGGNST
ncbi:MAG: hypothetical protein K8R68_06495, partial [Bacteroidales bacterium]|nr:hypothetical protein [Bacteroidales bacterium]